MSPENENTNTAFLIMQYEQAMETFRHGVTSLAQLVTVFVLADITLIGFAIDNQIAGIIFLGALFPIFIINSASVVGKLLADDFHGLLHRTKMRRRNRRFDAHRPARQSLA